jgi:lysyl-tRNA synthetase class 2
MMNCDSDIVKERRKKLAAWRQANVDPYGARFLPKDPIQEGLVNFEEGRRMKVAGRVMARRTHGKSCFADLRDESGKVQVYGKFDDLGERGFEQFLNLDIGDIVGVEGPLFKSRTGEITLKVEKFVLLSKILQVLPEKWHGLKDVETRYRRRYVDLIVNQDVRETFRRRSSILREIRAYLEDGGFMEVETPMMQPIPGGARAKPFKTYHEALNTHLYLRVAPELYLKRLLVGGLEKVYEINRNFRNEGLSVRHNPEFTMLELYQSYADLGDMMTLTEEMLVHLVGKLHSREDLPHNGKTLNFRKPWRRVSFFGALQEKTGVNWQTVSIRKEAARFDVPLEGADEADILNALFDVYIQPDLADPTFVTDYPLMLSPLAKRKAGSPAVADRFELYIAQMEIANAFSELNDPLEQEARFGEQKKMIGGEKEMDEDFLLALQYAMPPAGGLGIGIDRLVMILTDQPSIRDVIFFPQLRPEAKEPLDAGAKES